LTKASIFSAIVTTFVTQTYQSLQLDPLTISQGLLAELIAVQRAAANGSSVNDIPPSENSPSTFIPISADVWLNSLWFVSLILSLLTAFLGVLAKQWLYQYAAVTSGTPRARALVRQARNMALHDWEVPTLIGCLPIILHTSLALFLTGLIILLRSMLPNIAWFGVAAVGTVYMAYIISNILPVLYPFCPYRTALTPRLYQLYHWLPAFPRLRTGSSVQASDNLETNAWMLTRWFPWLRFLQYTAPCKLATKDALWKDAERRDALHTRGVLEAKAISWLYTSSYNPTAKQIVLEALSGLDPNHDQYEGNWGVDFIPHVLDDLQRGCVRLCVASPTSYHSEDTDRRLELYLRALIQIQPFCPGIFHKTSREQQMLLPDGVEKYWKSNKCSSRLGTLLACRLYNVQGVDHSESFLDDVCGDLNGVELSPGIWVALIRRQASLNRLRSFGMIVQMLIVLQRTEFFTSTSIHGDVPSMTLDKPSHAMCVAMFECIAAYARVSVQADDSNGPWAPSNAARVLLSLIASTDNRSRTLNSGFRPEPSEENVLEGISVILDCILQSAKNKTTTAAIWSSHETDLMAKITESSLFRSPDHLASASPILREVYRKTLMLLDEFCVPSNPLILPLPYNSLGFALRTFLDYSGMDSSPEFDPKDHPGCALLCWAFDQRHGPTYIDVLAMDIIPELYRLWLPTNQDPYRSTIHFSVPLFLDHFLAGVPTKQDRLLADTPSYPSYTSQLIDYIHQPHNLRHLCRILLQIHDSQFLLLRLLAVEPSHDAWVLCLVMLKRDYNESVISFDRRNSSEVREDILAMQEILNIHANYSALDSESRKALALDFGMILPSDNKVRFPFKSFKFSMLMFKI